MLSAVLFHPITTNNNVKMTKDAMVIPETGKLEVPIVPVNLPETMTKSKDRINVKIAPKIAISTFPPEMKNAATNPIAIPINNSKEAKEELFPFSPFFAPTVSLIEDTMVGINRIAPIKPPDSIIPAPIYFT